MGSAKFEVDIDTGRVRALVFQNRDAMVPKFLRTMGRRIETNAKQRAPVKSGNLRRSIQTRPVEVGTDSASITVEATVSYAAAVHEGSGPYVIRPRNKKFLKFTIDGKDIFAKKVTHPGSKPRPFLRNALEEEMRKAGLS